MTIRTLMLAGAAALLAAGPALAEAGDWIVRARAIVVAPQSSSGGISPAFPADGVKVKDAFAPELDVTYMLTNNVGLELIAATTKHSVFGRTGVPGTIGKLVDTWVLPPTVTLQYHVAPDGAVRPYVGAGLNYTIFYSERASGGLEAAVGPTRVSLSDSFGWAVQAGLDIPLNDRLVLNADVKYIDIDTRARLSTTAAGVQTVRVNINPIVAGVGLGFRF